MFLFDFFIIITVYIYIRAFHDKASNGTMLAVLPPCCFLESKRYFITQLSPPRIYYARRLIAKGCKQTF